MPSRFFSKIMEQEKGGIVGHSQKLRDNGRKFSRTAEQSSQKLWHSGSFGREAILKNCGILQPKHKSHQSANQLVIELTWGKAFFGLGKKAVRASDNNSK